MVFGHADISAWKALATKSLFLARRIMSFASACVAAIAAMGGSRRKRTSRRSVTIPEEAAI